MADASYCKSRAVAQTRTARSGGGNRMFFERGIR